MNELYLLIINSVSIVGVAVLLSWYIKYGAEMQFRSIIKDSSVEESS